MKSKQLLTALTVGLGLILAVLWLLGPGPTLAQGGDKLTRITTASASARDSYFPSLSADGTKVAFSSDSNFLGQGLPDDQFEIWLYNTATMTFTQITTASDSSRDSRDPSLSANGTKVAFESDNDFLGQGIPFGQVEIWLYDTATMTFTRGWPQPQHIRTR